jgi:hypothetical protein
MHTFIKKSVVANIEDLAPLYKGWHAFRRCSTSLTTSSWSSATRLSSLFHVSFFALRSPCIAMLLGTIDNSSMISHTSCTMPNPPTPSSPKFRFKATSSYLFVQHLHLGANPLEASPHGNPHPPVPLVFVLNFYLL